MTLAVLRGETNFDIFHAAETSLQALATKAHIDIKIETTSFQKTLHP